MTEDEYFEKKEAAENCIREFVEKNGELLGFAWHLGDGQGGEVIANLITWLHAGYFVSIGNTPDYYLKIIKRRAGVPE